MTATTEDNELRALWGKRIRWSRAAGAMKRRTDHTRVAALWLSSLGAIATTLGATVLLPQRGCGTGVMA